MYIEIILQDFVKGGSNLKEQKEYENVVKEPLLMGDPQQTVLSLLALPELHLLIGI